MNTPEDLKYTADHEWVRIEAGNARVGITDYAQDALGDVVFVEVPAMGSTVEIGGSLGEVESTKSVSDLFVPLSGEVIEVNEALDSSPGKLNEDPYGEGWLCVISISDDSEIGRLLDAAAYRELTSE
jgi:glycine cleavage system H protein